MNALHVIDLGIGFHRDLPIAIQHKAMAGSEPALVKLKFFPLLGDRPQVIHQARRVIIEVDENEFAEPLASHPSKASAAKV